MGDFSLDGKTLRKKGINRIGNMLVPNKVIKYPTPPPLPLLYASCLYGLGEGVWWSCFQQFLTCTSTFWSSRACSLFFLQNYCAFEEWFMPILDTLLEEQKTLGTVWTPSKIIHRLGKEIDNPESVYVIF